MEFLLRFEDQYTNISWLTPSPLEHLVSIEALPGHSASSTQGITSPAQRTTWETGSGPTFYSYKSQGLAKSLQKIRQQISVNPFPYKQDGLLLKDSWGLREKRREMAEQHLNKTLPFCTEKSVLVPIHAVSLLQIRHVNTYPRRRGLTPWGKFPEGKPLHFL